MSAPATWKATTQALADPVAKELDLLAFAGDDGLLFTRDGVGLAARGEAFRIRLPHGTTDVSHVRRVLNEVLADDPLHRARWVTHQERERW